MKQLGKLIWEKCLRGKPGTDQLLQKAAEGSAEDQQKLTKYLHQVLEIDATLRQEAQKLATKIHLEITNDSSSQTMNVYDNAKGWQTKVTGTAFIGENHFHGSPPQT